MSGRRRSVVGAEEVARFLAQASDDACCAWLCNTAGLRTRDQEVGIGMAVRRLAPGILCGPPNLHAAGMLRRVN